MKDRKLLTNLIIVDVFLLVAFCICLILALYLGTEPRATVFVDEIATEEPTATETASSEALPKLTPTLSLTPKPTATPTPFPTMPPVTPLPSPAIEEPTKLPYVFPTPLNVPGTALPTPSRTRLPR